MKIDRELLDIDNIISSKKNLLELFIRRTAVVTCTSEYMTEKIIKDQWLQANKVSQSDSSIGEINIPNIGTVRMSKKKANNRIGIMNKNLIKLRGDNNENQVAINELVLKSIKLKSKYEY